MVEHNRGGGRDHAGHAAHAAHPDDLATVQDKYQNVMEQYLAAVASASVEFDQVIRESMQQIEKLAKELDPNPESGDDPTHGETHHSTRKPAGGGGPRLFD